jgi:F-type H+-transporting ATPase subunit a
MGQQHEIWLTKLFNDYLPGVGNALLAVVRAQAGNPARPWANFVTMELLVAVIVVCLFAFLRSRLSVESPGKLQLSFEALYRFFDKNTHEYIHEGGEKHLPIFGTLFIFILFCNLIGIIPGLLSPTQSVSVPAGCALIAILYYNIQGIREHGPLYIKQFLGPKWWLAPLMLPIELASHLARPLSLTVRLFANMFAGEKLTLIFLSLTYFIGPAIFMGLHVFVSLVQAYVFAMLTTVYVAGAVSHEAH